MPVFGTLAAAILVGERFGPVRLAGMALIFVGLATIVLTRSLLKTAGIGRDMRLAPDPQRGDR